MPRADVDTMQTEQLKPLVRSADPGLRVLLAAHNDREAAQILLALRRGGFDVRHERVADAQSLAVALESDTWQVVVAEYRMPQWDGLEVLRQVQSVYPNLPVILVCGAVGEDAAVFAIKQGARDCISKQQVPDRLAPSVRNEMTRLAQARAWEQPVAITVACGDPAQEHQLRLMQAMTRKMFDASPIASCMALPHAAITRVNKKFIALTGYSSDELLGHTINELGLRVDDELGKQMVTRLRLDTEIDGLEFNLRRKNGSIRRVLMSSTSILIDGQDQILYSLANVTELRAALDESRIVRQALGAISQGVLVSGADRLTLSVNGAFETMTGYTESELIGLPCTILQGPDSNPATVQAMRNALRNGQAFNGEILNYRKDGSTFWNDLSISPIRNDAGELTHFVGIQRNVTEQRAQQTQLSLAAQVFAQSREAIVIVNANDRIVMVNQAFHEITGFADDQVIGKRISDFRSPSVSADEVHEQQVVVASGGVWKGESIGRRSDGSDFPLSLSIAVVRDANDEICNYVRIFSDISAEHQANERIARLQHFDSLTGLPNRTLLADRCNHDIHIATRENKSVAMMMLGVDNFKNVNQSLGQGVGDKLLKKLAARLANAVREQDTVARVGGDEFVLVLPGDSAEGADVLCARLLQIVARPFEVNNTEVSVTASIGIAIFPPDGLDFETLMSAAQTAMREAKLRGQGQQRFFNSEMFQHNKEQPLLGNALHHAIGGQQLHLAYQPFVDLRTGSIGGMEALLRWNHPELGAVSPARFIPVAERTGSIVRIGEWVLRQACQDIRHWQAMGLNVPPVSVNLSPLQFRDPRLFDSIERTLREFEVDPAMICLELTEGAVMEDVPRSEALMQKLKAMGLRLSLDDFGTGYSSLSYLKLFPFDKVKIDQSFVRGVHANAQDAVIVKVVISMAHGLGLQVIAEGVETELQCEFMRANVCDEIQGYFFSRPVPSVDLEKMLREDHRLPAHLIRDQKKARSLLLVDDDPNVLSSLKRLLRPDGYEISCAASGPEGLKLLEQHPVDIIVADQRMPGMSGVEFLREAKRLYPQTVRIVLSGHTELQSVTDAINEGAVYRFLTKPWDDDQLRGFIEQAFRHKELADENEQLNIKILTANQELAASNRQLQTVIDGNKLELTSGEQRLDIMHEALQKFPMPVLALDETGMVAFANEQAAELLPEGGPCVGSELADWSAEFNTLLGDAVEASGLQGDICGNPYEVHWHHMGQRSSSRGKLIFIRPLDVHAT